MVINTMDNVATQTVKYLNDSSFEEPLVTSSSLSTTSPPSPSALRSMSSGSGNSRIIFNSTRPLTPLFGTSLKVSLIVNLLFIYLFIYSIIF